MRQELQIFAFVYMYLDAGCLSRLCDSDFQITPVDGITIGITGAAFCFHIAHISFAGSLYFFCRLLFRLDYVCSRKLCLSQRCSSLFFLFMKVMSGRLEGIVLSVIMLRFQCGLKLSFSNTLAGVYL